MQTPSAQDVAAEADNLPSWSWCHCWNVAGVAQHGSLGECLRWRAVSAVTALHRAHGATCSQHPAVSLVGLDHALSELAPSGEAIAVAPVTLSPAVINLSSPCHEAADQPEPGHLQRGREPHIKQPQSSSGLAPPPIPPIDAQLLKRWLRYSPTCPLRYGIPCSQGVPNGPFIIDQFGQGAQGSGAQHFFLTHFHADHYKGLGRHFSAGTVLCTAETARLVKLKLGVRLRPCKAGRAPATHVCSKV